MLVYEKKNCIEEIIIYKYSEIFYNLIQLDILLTANIMLTYSQCFNTTMVNLVDMGVGVDI